VPLLASEPGERMNDAADDYPDFVARFYDVVYAQVRDGVDNEYYLRQIAASGGPVLEIGVGTGRLFCEALRRGADVDGVDRSASMVAALRRKLAPEAHRRVRVADAVTMRLERRYALILAPFRVLSHVIAVEEQLRLLDNVHSHLLPGGRFIFDLYVPSLKLLLEGMNNQLDFDGEYAPGRRLQRFVSARPDLLRQVTDVRMTFVWDEDGCEVRKEWAFTMRFFFRFEIEHLVARSQLRLEAIHGDFGEGPLVPESKEFIVVCRAG
jgi:SAM-dependent methyltransferase